MGIVPRKFPGIGFKELFAGNSQEFPQILSTFSSVFLQNWKKEIPWNWLQEIPWIELWEFPRNWLQEIPRTWFLGMGHEKFLGIAVDIFTRFSCERVLGISADFPQNCYLEKLQLFPIRMLMITINNQLYFFIFQPFKTSS